MVQAMVHVKKTRYRPNTNHNVQSWCHLELKGNKSSSAVKLNVDTTAESVRLVCSSVLLVGIWYLPVKNKWLF